MLPPGTSPHESCMPATIISGFLYLGSYDTASRQDLLKAMGITHVLNVSTCSMLSAAAPQNPAVVTEHGSAQPVLARHKSCRSSTCSCTQQDWLASLMFLTLHALQTVPTCPALYRNTFTYHTVEQAPPEFEECFNFLGEAGVSSVLRNEAASRPWADLLGLLWSVSAAPVLNPVLLCHPVQMMWPSSSRRCWYTA